MVSRILNVQDKGYNGRMNVMEERDRREWKDLESDEFERVENGSNWSQSPRKSINDNRNVDPPLTLPQIHNETCLGIDILQSTRWRLRKKSWTKIPVVGTCSEPPGSSFSFRVRSSA